MLLFMGDLSQNFSINTLKKYKKNDRFRITLKLIKLKYKKREQEDNNTNKDY